MTRVAARLTTAPMAKSYRRIETQAIHAGEPHPRIQGAVAMPIFQSATFEYGDTGGYHDLRYIRLNNTPNHVAVQEKLAALEGAEAALITASGMAAISTTLLTLLKPGDRLLAQRGLYGGTHGFLMGELRDLGIEVDLFDAAEPSTFAAALRPGTRAVYVETITNPLVEVADLPAVAAFAKAHGLVSIIDNTFASPFNFRPVEHGFDIVLHSCTKYLNGHSDLVAGAVVGSRARVDAITHRLNHFGGCLNPETCALLHRGMKTLALRVAAQNENALALARALAESPAVARVHYPGLSSHPGHARAASLFRGFGGMLSFEPKGGLAATETFLQRLTIPLVAPSLGGVETLVILPSKSSHVGLAPEERRALGIQDELVRVSVGIEAKDELIEDFLRALGT
ncbi:Cystathionine gamma-lyase [Minicystis rosea]|nr:Cystathionine gamma-lyase [Minicystis rosea]